MKRRVIVVSTFAILGLVTAIAVAVFLGQSASGPSITEQSHEQNTPTNSPKPIEISLPGSKPIPALHEDYNQPSSLWVVVNKQFALADDHFRPDDLENITAIATRPDKSLGERSLRTVIMPSFKNMVEAAQSAGHELILGSGFRDYDLQSFYFNNYAKHSGEEAASKFSARPGQSEHQTGLAFDLGITSGECYLETCFGDLPAGLWLAENAYKYGFILRYPADKTEITGYQYEPWHFRYVGNNLALALHESGLTLDEARPYLQTALQQLIDQKIIN